MRDKIAHALRLDLDETLSLLGSYSVYVDLEVLYYYLTKSIRLHQELISHKCLTRGHCANVKRLNDITPMIALISHTSSLVLYIYMAVLV